MLVSKEMCIWDRCDTMKLLEQTIGKTPILRRNQSENKLADLGMVTVRTSSCLILFDKRF